MQREHRYDVIKRKDFGDCLSRGIISHEEAITLQGIFEKLRKYRLDMGKKPLQCVVVESDWPEYERVWSMVEHRVEREIEAAVMETKFGPDSVPAGLPYFFVVDDKSLVCTDAHAVHRLLRYSGYKYKILYSTEPFDPSAIYTTSWAGSPKKAEMISREIVMNMDAKQIIEESKARRVK